MGALRTLGNSKNGECEEKYKEVALKRILDEHAEDQPALRVPFTSEGE